jgi:hypothetical protein
VEAAVALVPLVVMDQVTPHNLVRFQEMVEQVYLLLYQEVLYFMLAEAAAADSQKAQTLVLLDLEAVPLAHIILVQQTKMVRMAREAAAADLMEVAQ